MAGHALKARWGQPATGIFAFIAFFLIAWLIWFIFSDPRGPVAAFPYPFVMYLAMMILVGLWQHMFLGDWPFQDMPQPARGIVETLVNLALVWFIIHVVFYRILGVGLQLFQPGQSGSPGRGRSDGDPGGMRQDPHPPGLDRSRRPFR